MPNRRDDFSLTIEGGTLPSGHPRGGNFNSDIAFWGDLAFEDGTLNITFVVGAAPEGALPDDIPEKSESISIDFLDDIPSPAPGFTDDFLM